MEEEEKSNRNEHWANIEREISCTFYDYDKSMKENLKSFEVDFD